MSQDNIVISMDSHTHSFVDLKPWMPKRHHQDFDDATEVGRRIFFEANRMWGELLHEGAQMHWEMNAAIDTSADQYNLELTAEERLAVCDRDGVSAEFIIDGNGPVSTDPDLLHAVTLAYNRWFEEYVAIAPHRFRGAVIVNLIGGIDRVVEEIADAHEHGLAAIHLAGQPTTSSSALPQYNHAMYEPLWRALDERRMTLVFHGGVGREKPLWQWGQWGDGQRGWEDLLMLDVESGNFEALRHLLLAGVPERYPNVHFGWVETGSHWVVPILESIDRFVKSRRVDPAHRLGMLPSEMWQRQCFTSGPLDPGEIANRHRLGIGNLMFGSDYIHVEGTYPNTRAHLRKILKDVPPAERFAICAGNAARIMGFDLERLANTPAAQVALMDARQEPVAA